MVTGDGSSVMELRQRIAVLEREAARCEEDLRRSIRLFSQVFEAMPIAACLATVDDGRLLRTNQRYTELTGYEQAEVLGRTTGELGMWSGRRDREKFAAAIDDGGAFRDLPLKLRAKDGVVLDISASGDRIELDDRQVWLSMFTDTTARLRYQEELMRAIAEVMSDTTWFSRSVVERLAKVRSGGELPQGAIELTKREEQVLSRMAKGLHNDAIAEEFGIAPKTVTNHVTNIYQKLGVSSRSEAVIWARDHGVVA
ncbi:MAG TPA: LuxR C-terminal-related transcriptional regulator [Trueperaceae bacterium]|nr:LuxR C-terminal-related transcriptional regulator [Trueperaceae bacterium]